LIGFALAGRLIAIAPANTADVTRGMIRFMLRNSSEKKVSAGEFDGALLRFFCLQFTAAPRGRLCANLTLS